MPQSTIPQLNKVGVVGFSKLKVYEVNEYATIEDHASKQETLSASTVGAARSIRENMKAKLRNCGT